MLCTFVQILLSMDFTSYCFEVNCVNMDNFLQVVVKPSAAVSLACDCWHSCCRWVLLSRRAATQLHSSSESEHAISECPLCTRFKPSKSRLSRCCDSACCMIIMSSDGLLVAAVTAKIRFSCVVVNRFFGWWFMMAELCRLTDRVYQFIHMKQFTLRRFDSSLVFFSLATSAVARQYDNLALLYRFSIKWSGVCIGLLCSWQSLHMSAQLHNSDFGVKTHAPAFEARALMTPKINLWK